MKVYNYTGKNIRLYEIDWYGGSIQNIYELDPAGDIKIEEDSNYNISDKVQVKVYKPLKLPEYDPSRINVVDKQICALLEDIRPDFRFPSGKIIDPEYSDNYGYSLLLDWKNL